MWFELEKLHPSFNEARMELDGRQKSLLSRNTQQKNVQDLDKCLENKIRAGKNEKRATNVKVSRVDNLVPPGYTLNGSSGGYNKSGEFPESK